ncbi:MAG: hypothetical protein IPL92_15550 [Saprospiraceae bacterium]|nr:hypothetical protein [Candidatus Opimibacter iunctus]
MSHRPISINNSNGNGYQITGNIIGFANSSGTGAYTFVFPSTSGGSFIPIFLTVGTATATSVQNNTIAGIAISGAASGTSSSAPFRGIYVSSGLTTIGDVTGNTIGSQSATGSITYTSSSTGASDVIGIFNFGSSNWTTNNNTVGGITVANSSTGASNAYGIRVNTGSTVTWSCQNNIVGGTVANSIQSTSTAVGTTVQGIKNDNPIGTITGNTVRNLTAAGGTGTTTAASVIGISVTASSANHTVSQNTIYSLSNSNTTAATVVTGIQYTATSGTNLVARNFIYGLTSASNSATAEINGIRVAGGTTTYRNNMIAVGAGVTNAVIISGINEPLGTDNFFHNSVFIDGAPTAGAASSYAFNSTQTVNTRSFRDNLFVNARSNSGATGKNYAVRVGGTTPNPTGLTINNNVYLASGTGAVFGFFNSLDVADLTAWRTAVGQDLASFNGDPKYVDPTNATPDLHLSTLLTTVAEGNGADLGILDDYDGQTRSGLTPVDIGADAGNFMGVDLTQPGITYAVLNNTSCLTDRMLSSTITDGSGINTTAGTKPRLYYKKSTEANTYVGNTSADNGWKYVEATNSSSPFSFTTNYALLTSPIALGDSISYFVVAQDLAATPNVGINSGTFTAAPASVVLASGNFPLTGTVRGYKIVAVGLSGTVTIGAAGTYPSLTAASTGLFNAINTSGLSNSLTVEILDASVAETGAVALNAINYNGCVAGPYTLTIKPASGVTTTLSASVATGAVIKLNGADNVTIDGSNNGSSSRNLTFANTNVATSGNAVIWLAAPASGNGANNNIIKNCIIEGNAAATTLIGMYIGGSTTISTTAAGLENNNNNTIQNNLFRKSQYGLALFGYLGASPDNNNVINNNNFGTSVAGEGFLLEGIHADRQNALVVSGNEVQNVKSSGTASAAMYGIRLLDFKNGQAYKNNVHNLNYSGTSTAKIYGIAVQSSTYTTVGNPSQALIYNNLVYDLTSTGTSATWNMSGMYAGQGYGDKYYFNSIHLTGQLNNSSSGFCAAFANGDDNITSFGTNLDVRNNIFSLTGSSLGGNVWAYYSRAASLSGTIQNNNVLRCAGTGATNNVGRLNSLNYATLALWQAASSVDANSLESDPVFNSSTNLIPFTGSPTVGAGANGTGITTDYISFTRNTPPTIGAYEQTGDFAAPSITYSALSNTACNLGPLVTATITDLAGVNSVPGTKPRLYYKKSTDLNTYAGNTSADNGWKYVEASNGSSPFTLTMDFTLLQAAVVAGDIIQYFVVAQDLAGTPNVGINAGTFSINPASVALIAANFPVTGMNSYTILNPGLTGTVTIGAAGTYTSLTEAGGLFAEINTKGLSGNLLAQIIDPTLTENGTNMLNAMISTGCTGGPFTLTIKPTMTTTISGSSTTAIIRLNGADNVIIDGSIGSTTNTVCPPVAASRDLTIVNSNTGTSSAIVWMQTNGSDAATNNTVMNCILTGNSNTTTLFGVGSGSSSISITSLGTGNNNNSFVNNAISKTQYGIYSQGASTANKNTGTTINQNVINAVSPNNVARGGIWTGFENNLTISGNTVSEIALSGSPDIFGISLGTGTTMSATALGTNEVTNATVTKNVIGNVINSGTFSAGGIVVAAATSGTNLIANNMIYGVTANGTSGDFAGGIVIGGGTGSTTRIYYNTVSMQGTVTGGTSASQTAACLAVTTSTEPTLDMRNNIFTATQIGNSGATLRFASIALGYSTYALLTSNNNDLYSAGAGPGTYTIGITGGVAAGTSRTTLAAWQTETSKDGASLNILPVFVTSSNLHLVTSDPANLPLDNGAVTVSVTDDIDCDTRMTDIGADEFIPPACSAATGGTAAITGPSTFCTSGTPVITASGYSVGTGSGYQWMYSTSIGDYPGSGTVVMGQTNPSTLSTGVVSTTTYYWLRVTCITGMTTDNSNMLTVTIIPPPTASLSPTGTVNVCPPTSSQLLTSSTNASSPTYVWKKDGVVIGGETNPTYTATTTGGYTVLITDGTTMCSNTSASALVTFGVTPAQPVVTPSSTTMCGSDPAVLLTASGSADIGSTTTTSGAISIAIPDVNATGINHSLAVAGIPGGSTIDSIIVSFNITHNFVEDLIINLEAPNGQIVNLVKGTIASGANFTNTRASSDNSKPAFPTTGAPYTSTYRADLATSGFQLTPSPAPTTGTFSSLYSVPNGTWKIRVVDDESIGVGTAYKLDYQNQLYKPGQLHLDTQWDGFRIVY